MDDIDRDTALSILGNLEQGVPPEPEHVQYVRVGREQEERRLCDKPTEGLQSIKRGGGDVFFVLGDFGYGKSFFINLIADRTESMNMVWSQFDLQDIQDISNKTEIYAQTVRNLRYPDQRGTGIVPLLRQFCEQVDPAEFDQIATDRDFFGHSIYTMLSRLLEAWSTGRYYVERDDVTFDKAQMLDGISSYLQGEDVPLEMLHALGKVGFDHVGKEDEDEYLRHIRSLALELEYDGMVVLLDEAAEQLEWSPDSGTTQRLIGLVNKTHKQGGFDHIMFVFVGNQDKWDTLVEKTGHQALSQRYDAKKLVLEPLSTDDYVQLVERVATLDKIGRDVPYPLDDGDAEKIVDNAIDAYGGIESLSPRGLLLFPRGRDTDLTLLDLIRNQT